MSNTLVGEFRHRSIQILQLATANTFRLTRSSKRSPVCWFRRLRSRIEPSVISSCVCLRSPGRSLEITSNVFRHLKKRPFFGFWAPNQPVRQKTSDSRFLKDAIYRTVLEPGAFEYTQPIRWMGPPNSRGPSTIHRIPRNHPCGTPVCRVG